MTAAASALVGLGANEGDRRAAIERAFELLVRAPGVLSARRSSIRETAPVGTADAPATGGPYLNAAAEIVTTRTPPELLELCLGIEAELGRVRSVRNAPRPIDLDVLLFGDERIDLAPPAVAHPIVVPHPRLLERRFVLEPLAELCPERVHPTTGKTIREHLEEITGSDRGAARSAPSESGR